MLLKHSRSISDDVQLWFAYRIIHYGQVECVSYSQYQNNIAVALFTFLFFSSFLSLSVALSLSGSLALWLSLPFSRWLFTTPHSISPHSLEDICSQLITFQQDETLSLAFNIDSHVSIWMGDVPTVVVPPVHVQLLFRLRECGWARSLPTVSV